MITIRICWGSFCETEEDDPVRGGSLFLHITSHYWHTLGVTCLLRWITRDLVVKNTWLSDGGHLGSLEWTSYDDTADIHIWRIHTRVSMEDIMCGGQLDITCNCGGHHVSPRGGHHSVQGYHSRGTTREGRREWKIAGGGAEDSRPPSTVYKGHRLPRLDVRIEGIKNCWSRNSAPAVSNINVSGILTENCRNRASLEACKTPRFL